MKRAVLIVIGLLTAFGTYFAMGQGKSGDEKMDQDIEVAENILSTLIRQQFGKRVFIPMEVHGSYTSGFGVTFRLPENSGPLAMIKVAGDDFDMILPPPDAPMTYSYSFSRSDSDGDHEEGSAVERASAAERKARDAQKSAADAERKAVLAERKQDAVRS
ncbi:MAG TPA: hypothetical protein VG737_09205, partial [Cyclobacteriaceae bacterium]|nr:hypothetical protein [Cyclobacteriaceae bacterium]